MDMIVPVYLNQRVIFDLIAMLEGGIATVSRVDESNKIGSQDDRRYGAAFGLSQALSSLLKIEMSGQQQHNNQEEKGFQKSEERYHTPSSLLYKLRKNLIETKQLEKIEATSIIAPGQIVEFSSRLLKNPFSSFGGIINLLDVVEAMTRESTPTNKAKVTNNPKGRPSNTNNGQTTDLKVVRKQIQMLTEGFDSGGTIDVLSGELGTGHKAVLTLEREYLNDPEMSDLVDGHFRVLGKVIRVIPDSSDSIDLLRKSSFGLASEELFEAAFMQLSLALASGGLKVPELVREVRGPAIHVLPISIFA